MPNPFDVLNQIEAHFNTTNEINGEQVKWLLARVRKLTMNLHRVESHVAQVTKENLVVRELVTKTLLEQDLI